MCFSSTNYKKVKLQDFDKKNVKVIIFDFDNTLYKYLDWEGYNDFFISNLKRIFKELNDEQFEFYLKKFKVCGNRISENSAKMFLELKNSTKELVNFLNDIEYPCSWEKGKIFPEEILKELSKKYILYIVSNSSNSNIKYVAKNMKINLKYFKSILSNQFNEKDLSKKTCLKKVLELENISGKNVLMVGDSIKFDLLPAKSLGMKTLLIKD